MRETSNGTCTHAPHVQPAPRRQRGNHRLVDRLCDGLRRTILPIHALIICEHRLSDLTRFLTARGGEFLTFPVPDSSDVLVVSTVRPCDPGDCTIDHTVVPATAAEDLVWWAARHGTRGLRVSPRFLTALTQPTMAARGTV